MREVACARGDVFEDSLPYKQNIAKALEPSVCPTSVPYTHSRITTAPSPIFFFFFSFFFMIIFTIYVGISK